MTNPGRQTIGRLGEEAVCQHLIDKGCFIVEKNYHAGAGFHEEIDIIACDGKNILFVEVKTRKKDAMIPAVFAVTPQKQKRVFLCAQQFLAFRTSYNCYQPRFDVACVCVENRKVTGIEYYENAFSF